MNLSKEFRQRVCALILATVKGVTPAAALTQPVHLPLQNRNETYMTAIMPAHLSTNVRLSGLYHKNLLEQARFNTYCDTYSSLTLAGNAVTGDRPRRRESHTDKLVPNLDVS